MKRVILFLLAFVSFTLSINAQKYHAQEDRNRQYINYGWDKVHNRCFFFTVMDSLKVKSSPR